MKKLPNTLHELLRLAVHDAQLCEQDPGYELNMGVWYAPGAEGKACKVCMAGAVMVKTIGVSGSFRGTLAGIYQKLFAIDDLREGLVHYALNHVCNDYAWIGPCNMYSDDIYDICSLIYRSYDSKIGRAPWDVYLQAADLLEELHHKHIEDQKAGRV